MKMENVKVEMSSMTTLDTRVAQVTNVAPAATLDQMTTLFGFLGKIEEIKLYPSDDYPIQPSSRICYVKYDESWSVGVAQHLTNTVFIDRALIVVPVVDGQIPDESQAMSLAAANVPGILGSGPSHLINQVTGLAGAQVVTTVDPALTALGLPQYPPLPANTDPSKIEEIRRTIYVGNLGPSVTAEQLLKFFNHIGEVKYVRMAGDENQPTRFAFVEFTEQSSLTKALQYNGFLFSGRPLKVNHSNNAIVKPQTKSSEAAQREIEEAMKRVREAQSLITAAIEPGIVNELFSIELTDPDKKKDRSKSRSRSRHRSRSRSHKRSHSRSRSRRRSRSRGRRSLSRVRIGSKSRRRSRSKSHRKSPIRKKSRSRSKSKEKRLKRSSSPKSRKDRSRSTSRDRKKKPRRSRSRSVHRSKSSKSNSSSKKKDDSRSSKKDRSPKRDRSPKSESKKDSKNKKEPVAVEEKLVKKENEEEEQVVVPQPEQNEGDTSAAATAVTLVATPQPPPVTEVVQTEEGVAEPETKEPEEGKKEEAEIEPSGDRESITPKRESLKKSSKSRSPGRSKGKSPRRKGSSSPRHRGSPSPHRRGKGSPSPRRKGYSPSPSRRGRHHSRSRSPGRKIKRLRRPSRSLSPPMKGSKRRRHSRSLSPYRRRSPPRVSRSRSHSRSRSRHKHRSPPRHRSRSPRRSPSWGMTRRRRSPSLRGRSPRMRSRSPRPRSRTPRGRRSRTPIKKRSRTPKRESTKHKKKKSDRDRSRDKEGRTKEKKKKKHKGEEEEEVWDEKKRSSLSPDKGGSIGPEAKVVRNYDEEEKGYDSSGSETKKRGRTIPESESSSVSSQQEFRDDAKPRAKLEVSSKKMSDTESDRRSQQMDLDSD